MSGFVTNKGKKVWIRLIACRLPEEKILMAQQKKQRKSSKNSTTIKASTLEYAEWTLLVTTLGVEYGKEEILYLYRSRWQVELLFKRIKQNLRIQTVRIGSEAYLISLVYLWLIVWSLVEKQVFLAEKYWIESGKKQDVLSIWDLCSYYCKSVITIITSACSSLVDPFDLSILKKYLSSHKAEGGRFKNLPPSLLLKRLNSIPCSSEISGSPQH